jgi:hypothetical protein
MPIIPPRGGRSSLPYLRTPRELLLHHAAREFFA